MWPRPARRPEGHRQPGTRPQKARERRQRAVGSLRRSTDKQDQAIADQPAAIQRFANQRGLDLARFYPVRCRLWSLLGHPDGLPVISDWRRSMGLGTTIVA
jgi:hypothetical protein